MKRFLAVTAAVFSLFAAPVAMAEGPVHTVTVSGEAQAQLVPDQAILSLSLTSHDKSINVAKKNNDEQVKQLIDIAAQFNIPKEKIGTSRIYIAPEYTAENNEQKFTGYVVSRSLQITMDTLDIHEKLLSAIIDAKIDRVDGVEFRLSDPQAHAAELRLKAFDNAKTKASALAQAAGGKIGNVINISTVSTRGMEGPVMPMAMAARADGASVAPSLPGMVELHETVTVTFVLD